MLITPPPFDGRGYGGGSLRANGAHRVTAAAVFVAPTPIARKEVEAARVVRVVRTERGRPVEAVRNGKVEVSIPAVARSREENGVTVLTNNLATIHAILGCPGPSTVVAEFV